MPHSRGDIHIGGWQDKDHEEQWFSHIQGRWSINISPQKTWPAFPPWWCSPNYYFLRGMVASPRCTLWYGVKAEGPSESGFFSFLPMFANLFFQGSVWVVPVWQSRQGRSRLSLCSEGKLLTHGIRAGTERWWDPHTLLPYKDHAGGGLGFSCPSVFPFCSSIISSQLFTRESS